MESMFAGQVAVEVGRVLGRAVTPREITALFYDRTVPDDLGPVVGGRRVIRPEAAQVIVAACARKAPDGNNRREVLVTNDLLEEHPIPLNGVPKLKEIGPRRSGTRLDIRTVARWATKGVCGVVLETVVQGGMRYTSVPAVRRFIAAVTAAKQKRGSNRAPARQEEKQSPARVEAELDRLGI